MNYHETALLIAGALHDLEADDAVKALPARAKAKLSRLHRRLHEAATANATALKLDPVAYSGGGPKPA